MIECEGCGNYFDPDEMESCPECGMELCPACYQKHVKKCISDMSDDNLENY